MAMDVIIMKKSDFDRLVGRIEEIAEHIRKSENRELSGNEECWISNSEAMDILGVSSRTLQRYRAAVNEQDFHFVVCHVIGLPLS